MENIAHGAGVSTQTEAPQLLINAETGQVLFNTPGLSNLPPRYGPQ